jgi:hypothetical protein
MGKKAKSNHPSQKETLKTCQWNALFLQEREHEHQQ